MGHVARLHDKATGSTAASSAEGGARHPVAEKGYGFWLLPSTSAENKPLSSTSAARCAQPTHQSSGMQQGNDALGIGQNARPDEAQGGFEGHRCLFDDLVVVEGLGEQRQAVIAYNNTNPNH